MNISLEIFIFVMFAGRVFETPDINAESSKKTFQGSNSVFLNLFCLTATLASYINICRHP